MSRVHSTSPEMCVTCSEAIARILVFVANFAFLLVGGALLTLGILYTIHFTEYTEALPEEARALQYVPIIAIVVGSIIFLIAFLGCCGTIRSSTCMLTTYAAILFVIFLLQIGLGVFALLQVKNDDDLRQQINKQVATLFSKYNESTELKGVVDLIQQNLQCCGTDSPTSWTNSGFAVPPSCYDATSQKQFERGCSEAFFNYLTASVRLVAIVALAVSVTEIVGAVLALCLSNCIRANVRKGSYY